MVSLEVKLRFPKASLELLAVCSRISTEEWAEEEKGSEASTSGWSEISLLHQIHIDTQEKKKHFKSQPGSSLHTGMPVHQGDWVYVCVNYGHQEQARHSKTHTHTHFSLGFNDSNVVAKTHHFLVHSTISSW